MAVDAIDLAIPEGGIFGLLGPNGAGKTTTISICTTRALPTSGRVVIAGHSAASEPAVTRRCIGVVPQYNTLDRSLTAFENLYFHCRYFGMSRSAATARATELLEQFRLTERAQAMPNQLSGGLAQRLLVGRAIAHRPAVLFLDEPSAGLDPQSRLAMWEVVRGLKDQGITVMLTTHYMEEADLLSDRIGIIDQGKIIALDTPNTLKHRINQQDVVKMEVAGWKPEMGEKIQALPGVTNLITHYIDSTSVWELNLHTSDSRAILPKVIEQVNYNGTHLVNMNIVMPSLEDVFINLTGKALRD